MSDELRPNWETPTEFAHRMGLRLKTVSRKLHRPDCPQNYDAVEGPTGRIVRLRASWDLEEFMLANPRTLRAQAKYEPTPFPAMPLLGV